MELKVFSELSVLYHVPLVNFSITPLPSGIKLYCCIYYYVQQSERLYTVLQKIIIIFRKCKLMDNCPQGGIARICTLK